MTSRPAARTVPSRYASCCGWSCGIAMLSPRACRRDDEDTSCTCQPHRRPEDLMKQIAQNYKSGELTVLDVPTPVCRPGGVLVQSLFSLISTGTEMMKLAEAKMSMVGKARARPDQVRKVLDTVAQQGAVATYKKVMNRLDSYTPLGYSLCGVVVEVGRGAEEFRVGQDVAPAGNEHALHAGYTWVPLNLGVPVPGSVLPGRAALAPCGAITMSCR